MVHTIGVVIWFDNVKGFGMLESPGEQFTFIHIKSFRARPETIREKQVVVFSGKPDPARQRAEATNSRMLQQAEDWELIMQYLGKEDSVFLKDRHKQPQAATQKDTDKNKQPLMLLAAHQLLRAMPQEAWFEMITDYFDDDLDEAQFIAYCEFLEKVIMANAKDGRELLDSLFQHFGAHLDAAILFNAWKSRKFAYIGYTHAPDYEIPENILLSHLDDLTAEDLKRVSHYHCAPALFKQLIPEKLKSPEVLNEQYIEILQENIGFLDPREQEHYGPVLEELYPPK